MILPDELDAFRSFQIPKEPQYSLVSSIDGLLLLRRDLASLLEETDRERKMMAEKGWFNWAALWIFPVMQSLIVAGSSDCGNLSPLPERLRGKPL
jgi:hypothetical protein